MSDLTDDLRTQAERAIARLGSDEWFSDEAAVIARLLTALDAAEQRAQALRETMRIMDEDHDACMAEAERRAFEAGWLGQGALDVDAAFRTYQAKESPKSDARTTNEGQQTRQG